jgi:hypothetical protein
MLDGMFFKLGWQAAGRSLATTPYFRSVWQWSWAEWCLMPIAPQVEMARTEMFKRSVL